MADEMAQEKSLSRSHFSSSARSLIHFTEEHACTKVIRQSEVSGSPGDASPPIASICSRSAVAAASNLVTEWQWPIKRSRSPLDIAIAFSPSSQSVQEDTLMVLEYPMQHLFLR